LCASDVTAIDLFNHLLEIDMDSVHKNFAMYLHAEEDFLKRALRDFRVEERDVSDVELAHLFPDVFKDGEPLPVAA
jgi:cobalamin biosynthesis protein CbiG